MPTVLLAQTLRPTPVLKYIQSLSKLEGGFGWYDQHDAHLTPTYAVVGIMFDLGILPKDRTTLAKFIKTHHPQRQLINEAGPSGTELRDLVYQQIQSMQWLGQDVADFKTEVRGWKSQKGKLANYEKNGYPVLIQEMVKPVCYPMLGLSVDSISAEVIEYLGSRERPNGSYNNAPLSDGGDGNIINTYWSLLALKAIGKPYTKSSELSDWINKCQLPNGGFTHQPNANIGRTDDVYYLWSAVRSLHLLDKKPDNSRACINYLLSLRNSDGGYGNRPGLPSTPMATYYAINALKTLDALPEADTTRLKKQKASLMPRFDGYKVFTAQFQASGSGSPPEAVMLAEALKIHLWGAKNAGAGWIDAAQKKAADENIPLTFFQCDEPYGKDVVVPGMGQFGHILDYMAPANVVLPFKKVTSAEDFRKSAITLKQSSDWNELKSQAIRPLLEVGGSLILQVANNEPMARILLDESIASGGYGAISTIHFAQNFSFWLPYLHEYRHLLPMIALQDAHGTEAWWWASELASYRTLFIAREPTYLGLQEAMKNNWVVAVRHDKVSDFKTRMLGGADAARNFINERRKDWQWWNEKQPDDVLPWAAITLVKTGDSFEVETPRSGYNIRIRVQWDGTRNVIRSPLIELVQMKINNVAVDPLKIKQVIKTGKDSYYLYTIGNVKKEKIIIDATFRKLSDSTIKTLRKSFDVP